MLDLIWRKLFGYDVFISYARSDSTIYARALRDRLKKKYKVFLDEEEISAGQFLNKRINRALEQSSVLIPVISENAAQSEYVDFEINKFRALQRTIAPISVGEEIRHPHWQHIQQYRWIDEDASALKSGQSRIDLSEELRRHFSFIRRRIVRLITSGGVALALIAALGVAQLFKIEAQTQTAFAEFARALQAKEERNFPRAKLLFTHSLLSHDSEEARAELAGVWTTAEWVWDRLIEGVETSNAHIRFIADGKSVILAFEKRLLCLTIANGASGCDFRLPTTITAIATHPSLPRIALGQDDGTISVVEVGTGLIAVHNIGHSIASIAFGAKGRLLSIGLDGRGMRVIDAETGEQWYRSPPGQHEQTATSLAFEQSGTRLVWSMGRQLYLSDPVRNEIRRIGPQNSEILATAWSGGDPIVVAAGLDGVIQIVRERENTSAVSNVVISAQARNEPTIRELPGHLGGVHSLAFLPDNQTLVSSGFGAELKVWNARKQTKVLSLIGHDGRLSDMAVSPNGQYIASIGTDGRLRLWRLAPTERSLLVPTDRLPKIDAFSRAHYAHAITDLLVGTNDDMLLALRNGHILRVDSQGEVSELFNDISAIRERQRPLSLTPDGLKLLTFEATLGPRGDLLGDGPGFRIIDLETANSRFVAVPGLKNARWRGVNEEVIVGTSNGNFLCFNLTVKTGQRCAAVANPPSDRLDDRGTIVALSVDPKSSAAVAGWQDGSVALVDLTTGADRWEVLVDNTVVDVVIAPGGRTVAVVTSIPDAQVLLISSDTGSVIWSGDIWAAQAKFSLSGDRLAIGHADRGQITLVDVVHGRTSAELIDPILENVTALTFTSDGSRLLLGDKAGNIRDWSLAPVDLVWTASPEDLQQLARQQTGATVSSEGVRLFSLDGHATSALLGDTNVIDLSDAINAQLPNALLATALNSDVDADAFPRREPVKNLQSDPAQGSHESWLIAAHTLQNALQAVQGEAISAEHIGALSAAARGMIDVWEASEAPAYRPSLDRLAIPAIGEFIRLGHWNEAFDLFDAIASAWIAVLEAPDPLIGSINPLAEPYINLLRNSESAEQLARLTNPTIRITAFLAERAARLPDDIDAGWDEAEFGLLSSRLLVDLQRHAEALVAAKAAAARFSELTKIATLSGDPRQYRARNGWAYSLANELLIACFHIIELNESSSNSNSGNSTKKAQLTKTLLDSLALLKVQLEIIAETERPSERVEAALGSLEAQLPYCLR